VTAEYQAHVPFVHRGIKLQCVGFGLSLALTLLVVRPAQESRLQAALLLLIACGFLLDGRSLRLNGTMLAAAHLPSPRWIPWLSTLAYALGALLAVYSLVFLWHPRAVP